MSGLALFWALSSAQASEDACWVWPHAYVRAREKHGEIFLLQRHFPKVGDPVGRGPSPHRWEGADLHLVFRLEREPHPEEILRQFLVLRRAWERAGAKVAGLQLDYDSPTGQLGKYFDTLAALRAQLPSEMKLSATGLPDWLRTGAANRAARLEGITVFYQLYRGKSAQPEIDATLRAARFSSTPFRVGLLETQTLTASQRKLLADNQNFRGFVTFLGAK